MAWTILLPILFQILVKNAPGIVVGLAAWLFDLLQKDAAGQSVNASSPAELRGEMRAWLQSKVDAKHRPVLSKLARYLNGQMTMNVVNQVWDRVNKEQELGKPDSSTFSPVTQVGIASLTVPTHSELQKSAQEFVKFL